ncbi:MAG TPA: DUF2064 domain-containing protein [Jatrophihabitans sp.]|nr:DUF2064 domain-containing protein [Jatrophihabitans sp.]
MIDTLLLLAKEPIPGRVKTRLVPPLRFEQAADLALAALADTLRVASMVPARRRVLVLDGAAGAWLPAGWRCAAQRGGGLDARLAAAFSHTSHGPTLLIGMDTPQLRASQLTAFDPRRYDACLGPAADGGYWAIGFGDPRHAAEAIPGVPMSTACTGAMQLQRMCALGLRVQLLDTLEDVDTADAAARVAAEAPDSAFGRAVRALAVETVPQAVS